MSPRRTRQGQAVFGGALALMALLAWGCQSPAPPAQAPPPPPPEPEQLWTTQDAGQAPAPQGELPEIPAETTPPAAPGQASLPAPTADHVRAFVYRELRVLPPEVTLKPVVLDFDAEDEWLAEVTFKGGTPEAWRWLLLLDKRGEGWAVIQRWARPKVDATARLVPHGAGRRAALVVESRGAGLELVEVLSLQPGGALQLLARLGGSPERQGRLSVDWSRPLPRFALEVAGQPPRRWAMEVTTEGFAVRLQPAETSSQEPSGAPPTAPQPAP